jgi:lysophospholipase L1-like esterase
MNWETILSFGDSITSGARSYLGYPEICGDILGKKLDKNWHVINHAVNGFTTMDLVRSINPILENYKQSFPSIITVMIGTNDIKSHISPDEFQTAYRQLIIKLRLLSISDNVLLIKIPRLTKKVFYPYNYLMNEQIAEFNSIIERLGSESKLRCFEFIFDDDDYFDGVHLNSRGCQTAARQLSGLILKDKGIEGTSGVS